VAQCEVLVIESTFGHPRYRFPKRAEIYGEVCSFARKSLEEGAVPVFLAYVLGKGQEAVRLLADAGFSVAVHPSIAGVCDIYRELGCFLKYRRFDGEIEANEVLVVPAHLARAPELNRLGKTRTAVLTGWALDKGARFRYGTDAAFALSDHADFDALVQYVAQSGASKIFTVHGFAKELAACLRDRGFHAQPLAAPRQMELF
jgi:putative mRNA 3-end processing factor